MSHISKEQKTIYSNTDYNIRCKNPFNYSIWWENYIKNRNCVRKFSQKAQIPIIFPIVFRPWACIDTVDITQTVASRTFHVLIFIFRSDTWVITKRQHRHCSSLSAFCCSISPFSGEGKPWHLYALANTLWNKQSCEAEPGTNFISGCHLWLITGCSQWLASRSKVLGG